MPKKCEPIRVLCLFTILNRGGAETMCMNLYRHIDRTKVQFDFLVYYPERGIYEDEIEALGGHIYRIPQPKNLIAHIKGSKDFFKKHKEFSIVHNHMQSIGLFTCIEAKNAGVRTIIYHSHAGPLPIITNNVKSTYKRIIGELLKVKLFNICTAFFACGETAATAIPAKHQVAIIRNAIDLDLFKFNPDIRIQKRNDEKCEKKLVIGNVARLDRNKNQVFAIEVFKNLLNKQEKAELWLIGDGEMKPEIEKRVKQYGLEEKVRLFGVRTDVNELLQAMDVYLFPSIAEGLPVACIEAQASGLPCVFSDGFDPHTVITDHCRVVSLKESPEKWAQTILEVSKLPRTDTTEQIRKAGYDIKETAKYMEAFYCSKVNR